MRFIYLSIFCLLLGQNIQAQGLYFPDQAGNWDSLSPQDLGYCEAQIDSLYQFLDQSDSKAFILLKDGKIVLEQYFNGHTASDNWYWASAGKTLTAFLVGQALADGQLSLTDSSSHYLGSGWSSCTPQQEGAIQIIHQLSMTSGLDDGVADHTCTEDSCLFYLTDPALRWAYHNGPYTLLDGVLTQATGLSMNQYVNQKIKQPIGMNGSFVPLGYNNVYFSTARSMARFGLLLLADGQWDGQSILSDTAYLGAMRRPSQALNPAYGYLTWLNGQNSYLLPGSQFSFSGPLVPAAPNDCYMAWGKNGQFINIVPSENLVWIRMGQEPNGYDVPAELCNDIWQYINNLSCPSALEELGQEEWQIYPNPNQGQLHISGLSGAFSWRLLSIEGKILQAGQSHRPQLDLSSWPAAYYLLEIEQNGQREYLNWVKY